MTCKTEYSSSKNFIKYFFFASVRNVITENDPVPRVPFYGLCLGVGAEFIDIITGRRSV